RRAREMDAQRMFKQFISAKPKPIDLSSRQKVAIETLALGPTSVRTVMPTPDPVNLVEWADANRALVETELLQHGALLFTRFGVDTVSRFETAVRAFSPDLFDYRERLSPRT